MSGSNLYHGRGRYLGILGEMNLQVAGSIPALVLVSSTYKCHLKRFTFKNILIACLVNEVRFMYHVDLIDTENTI